MMKAQDSEPSSADEWTKAGLTNIAAGKLREALPAFEKACGLDPRDDDACYYFARTLYSLDRWQEAQRVFERALREAREPARARIHRGAAMNYAALGNTVDAERHFRQAVLLNTRSEGQPDDPRIDYGAFLFRQGRLKEALPLLEAAVKANARSARAQMELGRILLHLGKPQAAVVNLEKAVELAPRVPAGRLLLGRTYLQLGRVKEGETQLQLARDGTPSK
jgi:tetratricopeptide (TPR) repeat protein